MQTSVAHMDLFYRCNTAVTKATLFTVEGSSVHVHYGIVTCSSGAAAKAYMLWYDYTKHLTCNHVHVPVELSTLFTSVGAMK